MNRRKLLTGLAATSIILPTKSIAQSCLRTPRLFTKDGADTPYNYFNKSDGTLAVTAIAVLPLTNICPGDIAIINATTLASINPNPGYNYPGFPHHCVHDTGLYLTRNAPPGAWFDQSSAIELSPFNGEDLNPGAPGDVMDPYLVHNPSAQYQFTEGGTWYVVMAGWCASSALRPGSDSLARNEYILIVTNLTRMRATVFGAP